jgi:hypothetical protein
MPDDEPVLIEFLNKDGAIALVDKWLGIREELQPFPPIDCTHIGKGAFLFTRPEFVPTLARIPVPSREGVYDCIWSTGSCVLTYRRGHLRSNKLFLSTLSFHISFWDSQRNKVRKPKEFSRWARRVVAWLKDWASCQEWLRTGFYPATPGVSSAVKEGRLVLEV